MAGSVNKVTLIGNLGKDPEVRSMNSGDRVVNLSIATSESWRDKSTGERREKTEWHKVSIFNENLGKIAEQYLRKGSKVYLEGQLQTRKWQDQSGADKFTTEIVLQKSRGELTLLDGRSEGGGRGDDDMPAMEPRRAPARVGNDSGGGAQAGRSTSSRNMDLDDDIPF